MPLENAQFIRDLNANYPEGGDPRSRGDDHLRMLKRVLQATFPNLGEAITFGAKPAVVLPFASPFVWDLSAAPTGVLTLTGNIPNFEISNAKDGEIYTMLFKQDAAGGRAVAFPAAWEWVNNGVVQAIANGANEKTMLTIRRIENTIYVAPLLLRFA